MTLIARYSDGVPARRGDVLVPTRPIKGDYSVDFLSAATVARGSKPATVFVRGVEAREIPAALVGLVVEEVSP